MVELYLSADIICSEKQTVLRERSSRNYELQGTGNVQGQISEHAFASNRGVTPKRRLCRLCRPCRLSSFFFSLILVFTFTFDSHIFGSGHKLVFN